MIVAVGLSRDFRSYRCWLDGKEISNECFAASEKGEWALCYVRNETGHLLRNAQGQTEIELLRGEVVLKKEAILQPAPPPNLASCFQKEQLGVNSSPN